MLDLWTGLIFNRNCSLLDLKFQQSLTILLLNKKRKRKRRTIFFVRREGAVVIYGSDYQVD